MNDMNANVGNDLSLDERVRMLNADQKRVFDNVTRHLLYQKQHEDRECTCNDLKLLRLFISGVGGTGKSFLTEAIKAFVDDLWSSLSNDLKCAITAPTGLAAFNVGGVTIHDSLSCQ